MNTLASKIGERLKNRRMEIGISQTTLASMSGVYQSQISRYEKGEAEPNATAIIALAEALQTSTDWLLGLSDNKPDPVDVRKIEDLDPLEQQALLLFRSKTPERRLAAIEILRLA